MTLYGRRRATNAVYLALSWMATGFGLAILFLILFTLLRNGIPALGPALFVETTPPPGSRESRGAVTLNGVKSEGLTARLSVTVKPWNQRHA